MLITYIQNAMRLAKYEILEDGQYYGEIPGFQGVWANAETVEVCRNELVEVLEEWLILKIRDRDSIPELDGLKIQINELAA